MQSMLPLSPVHLQRYLPMVIDRTPTTGIMLDSVRTSTTINNNRNNKDNNIYLVAPYTKCLSKSFKNICSKHGVKVHFKGGNTIRNLLVAPKDKDTITKKSGVLYRYKCERVECDEEYIGESVKKFVETLKEHLKAHSLFRNIPTSQAIIVVWTLLWTLQFQYSGKGSTKPH